MDKKRVIAVGFIGIAILMLIALSSFAYAIVSHSASQVMAGTFGIGDFTFNGSLGVQNSIGNSILFVNSTSGYVGIGTTSPFGKLNVNGSLRIDNAIGGAVFFVNETSGNVGIGTTTPTRQLQVLGNVQISSNDFRSFEGFEDVAFPPTNWTTGGDASWVRSTASYYEGAASAASGVIGNSQNSWINTSVTFPVSGLVRFFWSVSSEAGYDYLTFCLDNSSCTSDSGFTTRISGSVSWTEVVYRVSAGTHTFKWIYSHDIGGTAGSDKGWIDNVRFITTGSLYVDNNIGIGTTSPNNALNVVGDVNITGSLIGPRLANVTTFTGTGANTWYKPQGGSTVRVQLWGGGGGGGGAGSNDEGGGGGGGGYTEFTLPLSSFSATQVCTVGIGGAGGNPEVDGGTGGSTSMTVGAATYTVYGGGGGEGNTASNGGGGGGGGIWGAGQVGTGDGTGGLGGIGCGALGAGTPLGAWGDDCGGGGGTTTTLHGGWASTGGGGGGFGSSTAIGGNGGSAIWGGGGGAGNGWTGAGTGGTSRYGGAGGTLAVNRHGTQPGGGGAGDDSATGGTGGAGKCIITVW